MGDRISLLKKMGNISQIAGIRAITLNSGRSKGTACYEVYNRAGLRFTVSADKCMDIYDLSYKGLNISFQSKNGNVSNKFFNALDNEFLYYWSGGMLSTCGLANTGPSCTDKDFFRTEHGRIGMTPADNLCVHSFWQQDDYVMALSGDMTESMIYGYALKLERNITTTLDSRQIVITDVIKNMEPLEEEFMYLYHFNIGYPLLDEGARIVKSSGKTLPLTNSAKENIEQCLSFGPPTDDLEEQVFYHECEADSDGYAYAGVINEKLGMGAYLKYTARQLPVLVHWKSMRSHDYVTGLEPSNSYIRGRVAERENGTLEKIPPYGEIKYEVTLGILEGQEEIRQFEDKINAT